MFKSDVLWKYLEAFLRRVGRAVVDLFAEHPVRVAVAGTLIVVAGVTGNFYIARTRQYQDIVSTTVRAQGEDTPQRFKVLEAFIMSTIDPALSDAIRTATVSKEFAAGLQSLHDVLSAPMPAGNPGGAENGKDAIGVRLSIPDYIEDAKSLGFQNTIITDTAPNGYLFLPLTLLRTRVEGDFRQIFDESRPGPDAAKIMVSKTLATAVARDPVVADDISVSRQLLPVMQSFTSVNLFQSDKALTQRAADVRPVQIYYITKTGVNRIVNNTDAAEQRVVYRNMFRSTTFFPSRPYFVEAFKQVTPGPLSAVKGIVGSSFYVSQPYLDIGGFGVVITLARPVSYASHSEAVICLDLQVPIRNGVNFQLRERLESFGTTPQEVTCAIGFRSLISCLPSGERAQGRAGSVTFPFQHELQEKLNITMKAGDLSTVVGNISILDDQTKQDEIRHAGLADLFTYPLELMFGYNARPITFAIPLSSPRAPNGARELEAQFMISSLNLERFQQITSLLGLASVLLLASAFSIVLFSWQGEARTRQSFEQAFTIVDGVLYGAPTPYCRLSSTDSVVDCNTAFCGLLKMPSDQESVRRVKRKTFESLIAPRSKATYHDVQQRRQAGASVAPYTLYFTCDDGSEVEARITSGVIPGRTARSLPETFGIVIEAPQV